MNQLNKKLLVLILPFVLLLSCSEKKQAQDTAKQRSEQKAEKALKITTSKVEARDVQRKIEIVGTLAAWDEVTVSNESAGTIDKISVDLGDAIKSGQVILKLNDRDAISNLEAQEAGLKTNERAYERAKALWLDAQTNLKRYTSLFAEGVASKKDMDAIQTQYDVQGATLKQAEASVNQSKALVNIAKKRVSDTEIVSPISGEVKKRLVSMGETIKDKTPLFVIVKNDPLKLKAQVSEQFLKDIKIGQAVEMNIDAFSGTKFTGTVARVSPSVDEKTRAMDIEVKIPNPKKVLKSGLFAKAYILTKKEKEVPFAPENAVYSFVGVNKVYVVKDNKVQDRTVKTGIRENGFVEIVEGVKPGEIIAASSLDQLFEGARVEE